MNILVLTTDNADADDFNLETGTVDLHCSDDSEGKERERHNNERRISKSESSTLCPECCKNLFTSCLSTMFYCCIGSEKRIELSSKRERERKHKERKTRLGISRSEKYATLNFDSYV